ncbi:unnamed protein product [Fusarium equiseti]|uniref:Oxidoreductase acuF-like C2H2 type zinc-finger domain-containing protein n=1 Tax=Fusarium equiseti TaxID=61235 RepID=A0A8J2NPI1_FUSEQ|nr:unnamed protein product [Fusarium equiseti]
MESLNEQDGYDPAAKVRLFLGALAAHFVEESIVARLCSLLLVVFRDIIQKLTDSNLHADEKAPVCISLQRSFDRLKLWSDGYRICAGDQDVNFIKSGRLRHATIEVLASISDALLERLEPLTSSKKTQISDTAEESVQKLKEALEAAHRDLDHDTSSSDSSSYYGLDNLEEIAKDLETDTLSLMGLDALFQSATLESFAEKAAFADAAQTWLPHDVYKDRIRTRFPKAESSLVSRLSKTSYDRYLRCQRERESQTTAVGDVDFPKFTRSDAASSKFQDSGLGTSIPSSASVAETVMSYRAEGKASVRIPPLSKEAKEGQSFECISCGKTLSIRNNSVWKRHLYQDLLPWQCLDPDCSFTTVFRTRDDWIAHIAQDHKLEPDWQSITCPLCFDTIPAGKIAITKHLCNHLEEISLAALPTNLDVESHSGSDNDSGSSQSQEESKEETDENPNLRSLKPDTSGQEPILQEALDYLDQTNINPDISDVNAGGTIPARKQTRDDDDQKPDRKTEEEEPVTFDTSLADSPNIPSPSK